MTRLRHVEVRLADGRRRVSGGRGGLRRREGLGWRGDVSNGAVPSSPSQTIVYTAIRSEPNAAASARRLSPYAFTECPNGMATCRSWCDGSRGAPGEAHQPGSPGGGTSAPRVQSLSASVPAQRAHQLHCVRDAVCRARLDAGDDLRRRQRHQRRRTCRRARRGRVGSGWLHRSTGARLRRQLQHAAAGHPQRAPSARIVVANLPNMRPALRGRLHAGSAPGPSAHFVGFTTQVTQPAHVTGCGGRRHDVRRASYDARRLLVGRIPSQRSRLRLHRRRVRQPRVLSGSAPPPRASCAQMSLAP